MPQTTTSVAATGNAYIDGLLYGRKWAGPITYSFPDSPADYPSTNTESRATGFAQITAAQQGAVHAILQQVENFTNLSIEYAGTGAGDIQLARSSAANPTAYAYYPGTGNGGDVWFGTSNYYSPVLGDYQYFTHLHEIGHALGLKHAHTGGGVANTAVPSDRDGLEFTVMTYRPYPGGPTSGYTNEKFGFPTTYMMNDILALQTMYGADYSFNATDTVYRWNASTGEMSVNGVGQGQPGANRVFLTVWDGGGNDTYDMSNYSSAVRIDLNPAASSITSAAQLAYLGGGRYAQGNVYNAYLFQGDARSYIENAIGGAGGDTLIGNAVDNRLDGGGGNDSLTGGGGNDVFVYGGNYGADTITDFVAGGSLDTIFLSGVAGVASFQDVMSRAQQVGGNTVVTFGVGQTLTLAGVALGALTAADFMFSAEPPPPPPPPPPGNSAPTAITLSSLSVAEEAPGASIGALTVDDPNGDTAFTFALTDSRFEVVGGPGNYSLKLKAGVALDYETATSVSFSVTATDAGGLSVTTPFTLSVVNVDEAQGVTLRGTTGADVLNGLGGNDTIYGDSGNDTLNGQGGNDTLYGESGSDTLNGGDGNDTLAGGSGTDTVSGGAGDDVLVISGSSDQYDALNGGSGTDTVSVSTGSSASRAGFDAAASSIEVWQGNDAPLLGTWGADHFDLSGLTSVTRLPYVDAGGGNDTLIGSRFADQLRGGWGNDRIEGGAGNDVLVGGSWGNDTFVFRPGFGQDRVQDFTPSGYYADRIEFDRAVFADYAAVQAASRQVGADVVITASSGDSVTLVNVSLTSLAIDDFRFV